jgi:hypothetical protein
MTDYLRIIPTLSNTPGVAPKPAELQAGELAFNAADGLLYAKNADGAVILIGPQAALDGSSQNSGEAGGDYGTYSGYGDVAGIAAVSAECSDDLLVVRWVQADQSQCSVDTAGFIVELKSPTDAAWDDAFHAQPSDRMAVIQRQPSGTVVRVVAVDTNGKRLPSDSIEVATCGSWVCAEGTSTCGKSSMPSDGVTYYASQALCEQACKSVNKLPYCSWTGNLNTAGGWASTGCSVASGQTMSFSAASVGTVTFKPAPDAAGGNTANPDGIIGYTDASMYSGCSRVSGWKHMALIGRIGASGSPFLIGSSRTLTASSSGSIQIAANDQCDEDNVGQYVVSLTVNNTAP